MAFVVCLMYYTPSENPGYKVFVPELIDSNTLLWKFEGGRCFIYSFDGGIYKKVKLPRPKYRDVESFKEISRDKFNSIIPITLKLEGGYSNNKYDRGGKTKYGIT